MKQIKVYLQYPWKFPDSPYYKYLLQEHPKEIKYLNAEKQKGVITSKGKFLFSNKLKKIIRFSTKILYPSMLNAHLSPKGDYDIIHCAHCLSRNKKEPWVCDLEAVWQLWVSGKKTKKGIRKAEKLIKKENCKKILCWTEDVYKELCELLPSCKNKFGVVYPAVPQIENIDSILKKRNKSNQITLLFVGRYFYWKGGLYALEVMDRLTKEYNNVNAICISETPKEIKEKYSSNKKIKMHNLMPQKKVFEMYEKSDIFVYPGFSDSFGFGFLEAMNFGLPVITVDNGGCRREIIEDGKSGFISGINNRTIESLFKEIDSEIVNDLTKNTSKLIEDKTLRNKMSKESVKVIKEGKFSIKKRNIGIKKAYKEALK